MEVVAVKARQVVKAAVKTLVVVLLVGQAKVKVAARVAVRVVKVDISLAQKGRKTGNV